MTQGDMVQVCAIINKEIRERNCSLFLKIEEQKDSKWAVWVTGSKQQQGHFPTSS